MNKIDEKQMKQISGGGISLGLVIGLGTILTFLIGVIDGYVRPLVCKGD